jgi:protein TonB
MLLMVVLAAMQAADPTAALVPSHPVADAPCPKAADIRYYPARAQRLSVEGKAIVACDVDVGGHLSQCTVISEEPANYGFGEAATVMAHCLMKMHDGHPGRTTVPLQFKLPGD